MYFYIIKTKNDLGFGITGNYESRAQDYVSHGGPNNGAHFPVVFTGHGPHIKKLEKHVKTQWIDRTHITQNGWKTEWLKEDETLEQFVADILEFINDRHLKIWQDVTDYNFLTR